MKNIDQEIYHGNKNIRNEKNSEEYLKSYHFGNSS